MIKSESITEISKALVAFQKEVEQPLKDADNPFMKSKYVPLENVVDAITPTATKHGLSFTQWALNDENGRVGVATLLLHESGEYIEYDPVFMTAEKNTPQGAGSLITYLKRYTLSAIFGITSDKDDDGNDSSGNGQENKQKPNPKPNPNSITQEQVGLIKSKSMEFAKLRNQTQEAVYKVLKITDVTQLTKEQADACIKQLDIWLNGAKKDDKK